MPIPDYQSIMLPLLKFASDKKEHTLQETLDHICNFFKLTDEEMSAMLPSGGQTIIENRTGWARTYLKKAGLLESPQRGYFRITERGAEVLNNNPSKIDNKLLFGFKEFVEFKSKHRSQINENYFAPKSSAPPQKIIDDVLDPMETLENSFLTINNNLADELLAELKNASPIFFEKAVLKLLQRMGYGDLVEHTGRTGDEGIDGKIREDKLGLDVIYVQAKRWKDGVVGRPEIHKFIGALSSQGANKGIFITTSTFTSEAWECGQKSIAPKMVLIDGLTLAKYMIDYGIGVSKIKSFEIKRKDSDFFVEE